MTEAVAIQPARRVVNVAAEKRRKPADFDITPISLRETLVEADHKWMYSKGNEMVDMFFSVPAKAVAFCGKEA